MEAEDGVYIGIQIGVNDMYVSGKVRFVIDNCNVTGKGEWQRLLALLLQQQSLLAAGCFF